MQPIFGNVSVNERIVGNPGKPDQADQPQSKSGKGCEGEEARMFAQQFAHSGTIAVSLFTTPVDPGASDITVTV